MTEINEIFPKTFNVQNFPHLPYKFSSYFHQAKIKEIRSFFTFHFFEKARKITLKNWGKKVQEIFSTFNENEHWLAFPFFFVFGKGIILGEYSGNLGQLGRIFWASFSSFRQIRGVLLTFCRKFSDFRLIDFLFGFLLILWIIEPARRIRFPFYWSF